MSSAAVDKFPGIFGVRRIGRGGGTGDGGSLEASDRVSGVAKGANTRMLSHSPNWQDLNEKRKIQ